MNKQKVLVLNGSISEIPVMQILKEMGYYVVSTGNQPDLIGHQYSDEYIQEDYSNYEKIFELVKNNGIDRIIDCANDFGAITASYVAEKMGWPGHDTFENTIALHQKDSIKELFEKFNIRNPKSIKFDDINKALEYADTVEYPIIVKAVDLTGGKGISVANNKDEAKEAIEYSFSKSRTKRIVIEDYIVGDQESFIAFIENKKVKICLANNAYSPINPYLIQTEIIPSTHYDNVKDELTMYAETMCEKMNLVDGVFTFQYIVRDGKPYVIEMMRRNLGNQYYTTAEAASGFPWFSYLVRSQLGLSYDGLCCHKPLANNVGHHGIMSEKNGRIKEVMIDPRFDVHIFKRIMTKYPGDYIYDNMNERAGWIYFEYEDRNEALEDIAKINDLVKIVYED